MAMSTEREHVPWTAVTDYVWSASDKGWACGEEDQRRMSQQVVAKLRSEHAQGEGFGHMRRCVADSLIVGAFNRSPTHIALQGDRQKWPLYFFKEFISFM